MHNYLGDDEHVFDVEKNDALLSKKLTQIEYYAKGYFFPVNRLAFGKKNVPSAEAMSALADDIVECGDYVQPFTDEEEKEFVKSFLFLAMTACAFFEQNTDAAIDLQHIAFRNIAGVLKIARTDGFFTYLAEKYEFDTRREHTQAEYEQLHKRAVKTDLEWYEYNWTESLYGNWYGADMHNDFFNLMYIICSVLQDKKYIPDYNGKSIFPSRPKAVGPDAEDSLTDPGLKEYESENRPDLFDEHEHEAYITSHAYLIEKFSLYADQFPCSGGDDYRRLFLERYKAFRRLFLIYGYKGNLECNVKRCLHCYLSLASDISFLSDTESFDKLYRELFVCVREIQSLFEEKIDDVLSLSYRPEDQ